MRTALIVALTWLLAGAAIAAGDVALLPSAKLVATWAPDGNAKVFTGSGLYGHIDGGAEPFFEFGFEELTVQRYANGADGMEVELYRMTDPVAALGIYLGRCGHETPNQELPERHTAGVHELLLVRDRYFLVVSNLGGKPELAPALVELARAIAAKLPAAQPVSIFEALPAKGRAADSERVIRGPLALQSIITLGDGDVLQLGNKTTAVAASYRDGEGGPSCTRIVAEYADASGATAALAHLKAGLDPEIKLLGSRPESMVFRDYSGKFGVAQVSGRRLALTVNLAREPDN